MQIRQIIQYSSVLVKRKVEHSHYLNQKVSVPMYCQLTFHFALYRKLL